MTTKRKLIPAVSSLLDLRIKAQTNPKYLQLAIAAAENLGGCDVGTLDKAMAWLMVNAQETGDEDGVVAEINFCR